MRKSIRFAPFALLLSALCFAGTAWALPTLTVGTVSGQAGTAVNLPVSFDPGEAAVTDVEFDLTLPTYVTPGTVTPGAILTSAGKSIGANLVGPQWRFLVFGMNQNHIGKGELLTAQIKVAPGTAPQKLSLPLSSVLFTSPDAKSISSGKNTDGILIIKAGSLK